MASNIAFSPGELLRGTISGGGAAPVAQTEAADTSADPVTVTLPALAGLEDGYIVRVYDSGSNASANNITIEDADSVEVDVIDEDDGERYLVVVSGAWEVRGYLPQGVAPTGIALLAEIMRGAGATPLIVAGDDVLDDDNSLGAASTALSVPFGSAVVARTADRAFDIVARFPDVASPSGGVTYLGGFGAITTAILCSVRCATALRLYHPQWSTNVDLATFADIRNKWVYIHIEYDFSALLFTAYIRIDGGAETTATLAMAASSSAGALPLHLGGNVSNEAGVSGLRYGAFGLYNTLPGAEHRAAIAAALGW